MSCKARTSRPAAGLGPAARPTRAAQTKKHCEDDDDEDNDDDDDEDNDDDDDDDEDNNDDDDDDSGEGDGDEGSVDSTRAREERARVTVDLIERLLDHWGTNACKIERMNRKRKHAAATTTTGSSSSSSSSSTCPDHLRAQPGWPAAGPKTSMITAQNVLAMLTQGEVERNANVEQWWKKVKKLVISSLKHVGTPDAAGVNALISLLNGIHPPIFIDKPSAHSQKLLPDADRCVALCADRTRCPKLRNRNHGYLCTMHSCHNPFGIEPAFLDEIRGKNVRIPVQLRLVMYRGINYYVDTVNNNVYHTDDIFHNSPSPRIIGTYVSCTTEEGEEKYTIPELDVVFGPNL